MKNEYSEQDLSFRLADKLEKYIDVYYADSHVKIYSYEIESIIRSALDETGLRLRISDPTKF